MKSTDYIDYDQIYEKLRPHVRSPRLVRDKRFHKEHKQIFYKGDDLMFGK